ncbi:MAG TPA: carbamoyltransferase C-terminal domain-containing protein [Terriglobia bacterium]|nr:carbamoyltransferase C-terminal domain-containing protein [Terriglobia bacterium]
MNVLGISGLANALPFKRAHWPGLHEYEYRISQGHDAAAALICSGKIVAAAAEERFNLSKHSGEFPAGAASYCLAEAGIRIDQVDEIAHGFNYEPYRRIYSVDPISTKLYCEVLSPEALLKLVRHSFPAFPPDKVVHVDHHLAHAASAYFTSGWDECLVAVIDGMGEVAGATTYHACCGKLHKLRQISANHSIGILYSLVTLHLGFDFNADEYKIMGLAPYGRPERYREFFKENVELRQDGSIRIPMLNLNRTRAERECYAATRRYLHERLIPERTPDAGITDNHRDVAAALQECLERAVFHICCHLRKQTGLTRLALAGGVALNCTANGKLIQSGMFDEVYVQPAAGDDGTALGAALYRASLAGEIHNSRLPAPLFGSAYSAGQIEAEIEKYPDQVDVLRFKNTEAACANAASLIADGNVIAWFRGRMEYGPRALGNRSILADPGHPEMRDRINAMVKKREAFRPFAPAVSVEQVHLWFDVEPGTSMPYMISVVQVRKEYRSALPAVTHVDGSARVQTVSTGDNPDFHLLLKSIGKITGREMLLNTSFNVKGQPIVNSPREAIETLLGTGIEFLFLENVRLNVRKSKCH